MKSSKYKKFEMPNGFVILFCLLVFVFCLTYIIPAGEYLRVESAGKIVVDGNSFKYIQQTPLSFFELFKAIPLGIQSAAPLIIMILLIGGSVRIFDGTGAIRASIYKLIEIVGEDKDSIVLIVIMLFFGCLGTFPGMLEAAIPFAPLTVSIALMLGYDLLVGIYIALVPIVVGWSAGVTNPWTVGIGHNLAQLPMFSGISYRIIVFVFLMIITIIYILNYAKKIKLNPKKSIVYGTPFEKKSYEDMEVKFTRKLKLVILIFISTISLVVYGALNWKWGLVELSAIYIIGAIIGGIIAGYTPNKIANEILEGSRSIFVGTMAIGLARAISVIMEQGHILDTIVYFLSNMLSETTPVVSSIGMAVIQTVINFFVPSGSGQAVVTLPIMIPVADLVGINRQIAILAFQFGDGLSNLIFPTVGVLIAFLSYTKVSFKDWFRFIIKFMIIIWSMSMVLLAIAVLINYS